MLKVFINLLKLFYFYETKQNIKIINVSRIKTYKFNTDSECSRIEVINMKNRLKKQLFLLILSSYVNEEDESNQKNPFQLLIWRMVTIPGTLADLIYIFPECFVE